MRKGSKMSREQKQKISESGKGRVTSETTKNKISMSYKHNPRFGIKASRWAGGRHKNHAGYVYAYSPHHPYANKRGYVFEHRLVIEAHIGRVLLPTEVVHHINGIKNDNRIENLMLFSNNGQHTAHHNKKGA